MTSAYEKSVSVLKVLDKRIAKFVNVDIMRIVKLRDMHDVVAQSIEAFDEIGVISNELDCAYENAKYIGHPYDVFETMNGNFTRAVNEFWHNTVDRMLGTPAGLSEDAYKKYFEKFFGIGRYLYPNAMIEVVAILENALNTNYVSPALEVVLTSVTRYVKAVLLAPRLNHFHALKDKDRGKGQKRIPWLTSTVVDAYAINKFVAESYPVDVEPYESPFGYKISADDSEHFEDALANANKRWHSMHA